jgi:cytochrome c-type biogenesis protein CcmH
MPVADRRSSANQWLKRWPGWAVLAVCTMALLVVGAVRAADQRTVDERVSDISKRVACPICDGESVYESRNGASDSLRAQIRQQVQAGRTDAEVLAYVQSRSPDQDLTLVPEGDGIGLWIWTLPILAVALGAVGLGAAFVRWRSMAATSSSVSTEDERRVVAAVAALAAEVEGVADR